MNVFYNLIAYEQVEVSKALLHEIYSEYMGKSLL